ncbi:hypothetical protein [Methylobacterium organophilum]|uniref:hypothetical protein n=1 Tax=Methylobacterium organophilum TaxID=410 RepID=UPI001EE29BD2|nr:hypothetical protein [Methylobacterium organophilum]
MLNRSEAASYLGLGATAAIPVQPKRVRPGKQGLRYDVRDLDRWIDSLETGEHVESIEDLLNRPGHGKGARPRR